jgi:hypothetical protein
MAKQSLSALKATNKDFNNVLDSFRPVGGFREITVVTAADASHTLTEADSGVVLISAALASGAVIKLPDAGGANMVGWHTKLVFTGVGAAAYQVQLPNAGAATFAGVLTFERGAAGAGVADAVAVNRVECVIGADEKSIDFDENDVTFGGSVGTVLDIFYASSTKVVVTGRATVNVASTAVDALTATSFTGTGY